MGSYIRQRFRHEVPLRTLGVRLTEGEEELQRMLNMLVAKAHLTADQADRLRHVVGSTDHATAVAPKKNYWNCNEVGAWLSGLGLAHHALAFEKLRVDGRLLSRIDDEDLRELGVESRIERKRLLMELESLKT